MMNDDLQHAPLSPDGQARRDAMLDELVAHMSLVHRRRRRARLAALSTAASALIFLAIVRFAFHDMQPGPRIVDRGATQPREPHVDQPASAIVWLKTDPGVVARLRPDPNPIVERIDDTKLLETLLQIGRPAGLIRYGDRLALSAPVTDDELNSVLKQH